MNDCVFCKIVAGELPSRKVYEDDEIIAFHDISPLAAVHLLIIPKVHIVSLAECTPEHQDLLGRMLLLAPRLAQEHGLQQGFRTAINTGRGGGQTVFHLHINMFGGGDRPVQG
ncbi:MAG: histidine triad nucleotide-binding protein [Sulfuriferula sp.]